MVVGWQHFFYLASLSRPMSGKLLDFLESSLLPLLLLLFRLFSSRNLDRQTGCCSCCLPKLYHVISLPGLSRPEGRELGGCSTALLFSSERGTQFFNLFFCWFFVKGLSTMDIFVKISNIQNILYLPWFAWKLSHSVRAE